MPALLLLSYPSRLIYRNPISAYDLNFCIKPESEFKMPNINFSDKLLVSIHNAIGSNISSATTKGLLDKIKNIKNGSGEVPKGIINALTKKAESTKNTELAKTINFALTDIHSSKAINITDKGIVAVKKDISDNQRKIKSSTEIDNQAAGKINKSTTQMLPDDKVRSLDLSFRLFVSAQAKVNGLNLQLPNEIKQDIKDVRNEIKNLSRQSDLLTLVKSSFVLRLINNSDSYKNASVAQKKEFIKTAGESFEKSFCEGLVKSLSVSPEMKKIVEHKGITPFTQNEITKLLPSDVFSKNGKAVTHVNLMASVLKKTEKRDNKLSELKNTLSEAQNKVNKHEISAAKEFIGLSKDNSQSSVVKKIIATLDSRTNQIQESKDAPKKIETAKNQLNVLVEMRETAVETHENNQHLQLMNEVLQIMEVGNKAGSEILQYNTDLQNDVKTSWGEAFTTKQEIDNALVSNSSSISSSSLKSKTEGSDTKPDTLNNSLSELPNVPDHNPSIDIVSKTEKNAKVEIAG